MSLKDRFPDIFTLAQHQQKTVGEMWTQQGWDLIFRRNLNDWEIPRILELFKVLESFQGIQTGEDYLWWQGHNKGSYKVTEGYKQKSLGGIQGLNGLGRKSGGSKCHTKWHALHGY